MKSAVFLTILIIFFISLGVCCVGQSPNLENTSWKLDSYLSSIGHIVSPISSAKITLEFKDGKISGSSGCNNYFAKYTTQGSSITFGLIGATKMHCTVPSIMEQESTYLTLIESTKTYKVEGNKLKLMDNSGKVIFTFSKQ